MPDLIISSATDWFYVGADNFWKWNQNDSKDKPVADQLRDIVLLTNDGYTAEANSQQKTPRFPPIESVVGMADDNNPLSANSKGIFHNITKNLIIY